MADTPDPQSRVPEVRPTPRRIVRQSHLAGVLSTWVTETSLTPIVPAQRTPFLLPHPSAELFTRWIEAETRARDVRGELGGQLLAELEAAVLLVLRVLLDQEPLAGGVELRVDLDDRAAYRQDGGRGTKAL